MEGHNSGDGWPAPGSAESHSDKSFTAEPWRSSHRHKTVESAWPARPKKGCMLRQAVDSLPAQTAVVDRDWNILAVNAAWRSEMTDLGFGAELSAGRNYRAFCEKVARQGVPEADVVLAALESLRDGRSMEFRYTFASNAAPGHHFHLSISRFDSDALPFATITRIDITELFELRAQAVSLGASLMHAQEAERRRIARELHDTTAQYLVVMDLALLRLHALEPGEEVSNILLDLDTLTDEFHRELRGLTYLLHPPHLEEQGLKAALKALCEGFGRRSGLDIAFAFSGDDYPSSRDVDSTLYRLAQEALSNVQKHAFARHAEVRLSARQNALRLQVTDDGVGIDIEIPDLETGNADRFGVGIPGMIARVRQVGGRLAIRRLGRGTSVVATVPRPKIDTSPARSPRLWHGRAGQDRDARLVQEVG